MEKSASSARQERLRQLLELADVTSELFESLDRAFVHQSAAQELEILSNERMEFLGDAVLGLVVARWLYEHFPDEREGALTKRKAVIVSGAAIARTSARLGFSDFILLGTGERAAGGDARPSILAGAFEAFVAALFLNHGLEAAQRFIEREHLAHFDHALESLSDPKSELQEISQAQFGCKPVYAEITEGAAHARVFTSIVRVDGKKLGKGTGPSKKAAQQDAALQALQVIRSAAAPSGSDQVSSSDHAR